MSAVIETFRLTKHYPKGVVGVEDLTLSVQKGEIYGFLGSNGAGKTTTIRLLLNLLFPSSGGAKIFGRDAVKGHLDISRRIGYLPSAVRPFKHMSGSDFLDYMGSFYPAVEEGNRRRLLERFEFGGQDLKRKVKDYSSGMARKIAIVQAFQHNPELVVLDEPTEGLDPVMQHRFYQLLRDFQQEGGTVFISSHHLREVERVCHRAAIIRKGKLVTVETVQHLLERMAPMIYVTFDQPVHREQLLDEAWEITELNGQGLTARLTGDINRVVRLLGQFQLKSLSLPSLSLEDVFLGYYREDNNDR
jgi:ABC-2 type transport system ATP-binding protein